MAGKKKTPAKAGKDDAEGVEIEGPEGPVTVKTLADGQNLAPGIDPPPPAPELWKVTRTFAAKWDAHRSEEDAAKEEKPQRFLGKWTVRFTASEENISADCPNVAQRLGCDRLDEEVMTEEQFAGEVYPGANIITTVKVTRTQSADEA